MKLYIDDAGSFSWSSKGISLFAGLTIPDRISSPLTERFLAWKRSVIGAKSTREVKGAELTPNQLESFSYKVFSAVSESPRVTVCGFDTRYEDLSLLTKYRDQTSDLFREVAAVVKEENPSNRWLIQHHTEMAGWLRKRSPENMLWMWALMEVIHQTFQHSLAYYLEPSDDPEFESIEILIDRSFIRQKEHLGFWKELLRNGLSNRRFLTLDEWRKRDHPFHRNYPRGEGDAVDLRDIFLNHLGFANSHDHVGLQLADISAQICLRYFRGETHLAAYRNLRRHIVGRQGRAMTILRFEPTVIIQKGNLRDYIHMVDWTKKASSVVTPNADAVV